MRLRLTVAFVAMGLVSSLLAALVSTASADTACNGVAVTGGDLAAQVSAAPAGTTFCIASGVYRTGEVAPKKGDRFIGAPGAVLDGGRQFGRAFANYGHVDDVVIQGLDIRNYSLTYGGEDQVIGAWLGSNWQILDNRVHDNASSGIGLGNGTLIRGNLVDHNGCGGIMGGGTNDTIENNEIAFNNIGGFDSVGWSCGGGKAVYSVGLRFIDNYSHDNKGRGYWLDGDNTNALISGNRFENNPVGGLLLEINDPRHGGANHNVVGTGITVQGNVFKGNGMDYPNRVMYGPAIEVSATNHVEIVGNLIAASNAHAVTFTQTSRTDFSGEDLTVHDIDVHDNDIGLRTSGGNAFSDIGRVGFYSGTANPPTPTNMSFANNRYYFDDSSAPHFSLPRTSGQTTAYRFATWAQWRAAGYDTTSSVLSSDEYP